MPEAAPPQVALCPSDALQERGTAYVFDLLEYGRPVRGFVLRFDGQVWGYLNRCVHVPMEMDWQAGVFMDSTQRWILCSTHGAAYEPTSGRCVAGPCGRAGVLVSFPRPHAGIPGLTSARPPRCKPVDTFPRARLHGTHLRSR
jgi:nitrite reductase/ring-hydroxylating ferredoxin subunit